MRCGIDRPGYDAWVGVGVEVLRYVRALEVEIEVAGARLEIANREHADELKNLRKTVASKDREIRRVGDELKLAVERLGLGSANSSKPPSTDGLGAPKRAVRLATGKRRGGQPRHPFHARALVETVACATVTEHRPEACRGCGAELTGDDPEPLRHQIVELPRPVPRVDEHRLHSLQHEQFLVETLVEVVRAPRGVARQVGSSDSADEESVAGQHEPRINAATKVGDDQACIRRQDGEYASTSSSSTLRCGARTPISSVLPSPHRQRPRWRLLPTMRDLRAGSRLLQQCRMGSRSDQWDGTR